MSAPSRNFTVLCPKGRRQKVTVSLNASCLQVLEEACEKQNLNPEDYDLIYYNKRVDLSTILRFGNFPNNALFELSQVEECRTERAVRVCLQPESGDRLTKEFSPSSSLWDVICHWQNERNSLKNENQVGEPVCIYMRKELIGQEMLNQTTLRSLGLIGGSAIIRLIYRIPESLKEQAHVCVPLIKHNVTDNKKQPENENFRQYNNQMNMATDNSKPLPYLPSSNQQLESCLKKEISSLLKQKQKNNDDVQNSDKPIESMEIDSASESEDAVQEKIIYIGGRNAVLFNMDDILPLIPEEIPDQFYELTLDDARFIYEDLKRQRIELEEKTLETSAQREEKEKKRLSTYKITVIRIYFPERLVLQAVFSPTDTVGDVMAFIRRFLSKEDIVFHLYLTPPKQILSPQTSLYKAGLVPASVVYFSSPENQQNYLNEELKTKISSPDAAKQTAFLTRKKKCDKNLPSTSKQ